MVSAPVNMSVPTDLQRSFSCAQTYAPGGACSMGCNPTSVNTPTDGARPRFATRPALSAQTLHSRIRRGDGLAAEASAAIYHALAGVRLTLASNIFTHDRDVRRYGNDGAVGKFTCHAA